MELSDSAMLKQSQAIQHPELSPLNHGSMAQYKGEYKRSTIAQYNGEYTSLLTDSTTSNTMSSIP